MAKWNVYAPDGLVEELRAQDAQVNLSALFQQAIRARLAEVTRDSERRRSVHLALQQVGPESWTLDMHSGE